MRARTAVIQMNFSRNTEQNVEKGARLIKEAAGEGADIIALPELATNIYFPFEMDPKHFTLAEPIPGPSTQRICAAAKEANAYVTTVRTSWTDFPVTTSWNGNSPTV